MGVKIQQRPDAIQVASFLDISVEALAERDRFLQPIDRWLAYEGQDPIGLATAFTRPDDRLFVTHRLTDESAFRPLLDVAVDGLDRDVHITVGSDQNERLASAERAGFSAELHSIGFDIPIQPVLAAIEGYSSERIEILPADQVDPAELFRLDTELRQDVPGNDGWRGNRVWFDDELASPECDPAAYPVARARVDGTLVGLCRFWNNPSGPALGMIGIRREYRTGRPALSLLYTGLQAANDWGCPTFQTHTARGALQRRARAFGATEIGGFVRLRRSN